MTVTDTLLLVMIFLPMAAGLLVLPVRSAGGLKGIVALLVAAANLAMAGAAFGKEAAVTSSWRASAWSSPCGCTTSAASSCWRQRAFRCWCRCTACRS
jgi:hypothetical protein